MDQSPEAGVVEVVDMAICLSPVQVVLEAFQVGISHKPGVKRGWVLELSLWEETAPVEDIAGSKVRYHSGAYLTGAGKTFQRISNYIAQGCRV